MRSRAGMQLAKVGNMISQDDDRSVIGRSLMAFQNLWLFKISRFILGR